MRFLILLVAFASPLISAKDPVPPPGCPEKCRFVFSDLIDKDIMSRRNPGSQFYGIGRVQKYKLDYGNLPNDEWPSTTIVSCDSEVVWGAAYCISNSDFQKLSPSWTTLDGQQIRECVELNVEINVNGAAQNIQCSSYPLIKSLQPPPNETPIPEHRKPATQLLNDIANACCKAGIPQDYIEKVKAHPSRLYVESG